MVVNFVVRLVLELVREDGRNLKLFLGQQCCLPGEVHIMVRVGNSGGGDLKDNGTQ